MKLKNIKIKTLIFFVILIYLAITTFAVSPTFANTPSTAVGRVYMNYNGSKFPLPWVNVRKESYCGTIPSLCPGSCPNPYDMGNNNCWVDGVTVYSTSTDLIWSTIANGAEFRFGQSTGGPTFGSPNYPGTIDYPGDGSAAYCRNPDTNTSGWCGLNCAFFLSHIGASIPIGYNASNFPSGLDMSRGNWQLHIDNAPLSHVDTVSPRTTVAGDKYNVVGYGNDWNLQMFDFEWVPKKTCSVSLSSSSVTAGTAVTATVVGYANKATSEPVKLWVERQDGAVINPPPVGVSTYNSVNYYKLNECQSGSSTCTTSSTVTLPTGSYYFHCDLTTDPGKCSGNPFCNGNEIGGTDCAGWSQCGPNDSASLTVTAAPTPTPTPTPTPGAPSITSLQVGNIDSHGFTGTDAVKTAGLQFGPQGGSGWYNPMTITLNANQGSNPIKSYYVAFYDKNEGTGFVQSAYTSIIDPASGVPASNLSSLLQGDRRKGFVLRYDNGGSGYVWSPALSAWVDLSGYGGGFSICGSDCASQPYYTVSQVSSSPPSWEVLLDEKFLSKNMYTAAYVMDNSAAKLSTYAADCTPTNASCLLR